MNNRPARVIEISLVSADGTREVLIDATARGDMNFIDMHTEVARGMNASENVRAFDTLMHALASGLVLIDPSNIACINLLHAYHRLRTGDEVTVHPTGAVSVHPPSGIPSR